MTTDKANKVHPVVEAMARAIAEACSEPQAWVAHIEPAKAAAKVLIEECAKKVPSNWLDPSVAHMRGAGPITCSDVELAMQNTAARIRSLKTELGLEG